MNFLILPLLAASNYLDNTDPTWQFGPEIIYNVTFNADAVPPLKSLEFPNTISTNLTCQLKCRYREPDYLYCHLGNAKAQFSVRNSTDVKTLIADSDPPEPYTGLSLTFGIKFDQYGIDKLVIPPSISPAALDKIRFVINQFHTGIDLVGKSEGIYHTFENFTTGNCYTEYCVQLDDTNEHHESTKTGKYKMWTPGMKVAINKTRDMNDCKLTAPYFFESRENWKDEPKLSTKVKTSRSTIIADRSTFYSSTETTMDLSVLKEPKKSGIMKMRENITIIYDSVVPAKAEFPEIENPASAGIITGKWVYDDDESEENSAESHEKSEHN